MAVNGSLRGLRAIVRDLNAAHPNRREFMRLTLAALLGFAGRDPAVGMASNAREMWVLPRESLSLADQVVSVTLQGLVNRRAPRIWMREGSAYQTVLDQLEREGVRIRPVNTAKELLSRFRSHAKGAILCRINTPSLNAATSLCGLREAVALDESLAPLAEELHLPVLMDVRGWDDRKVFNEYRDRLGRGVTVQQTPEGARIGCVRDFAVAHNAFTYFTTDEQFCTEVVKAFGPNTSEYGSGALPSGLGEYPWFCALSRGNGSGVATDWSSNLSALEKLPAKRLIRPRGPEVSREDHVRYVAFVMTDGDNVQWLCGGFVGDARFWSSPLRGQFPFTWGLSPMLAVVAPRVLEYLYATARKEEGFITGPGEPGCSFLHLQPDPRSLARYSEPKLRKADMPVLSVINTNEGDLAEAAPLMDIPFAEGVLYQDYSPYNRHGGKDYWRRGKPCVSFKFMLWEGNGEGDMNPQELAQAIGGMPTDPFRDEYSYALVAVHAWSWAEMGGPLEAVRRTIAQLPSNTRVITADQMVGLMRRNLGGQGGELR